MMMGRPRSETAVSRTTGVSFVIQASGIEAAYAAPPFFAAFFAAAFGFVVVTKFGFVESALGAHLVALAFDCFFALSGTP